MADLPVRWKDKPSIITLASGDKIPATKLSDNKDYHTTPEQIKSFVETGAKSSVLFDPTVDTPSYEEGLLFYDKVYKTLDLYNDDSDIALQIGQSWTRVYNDSGGSILKGQPVYPTGNYLNTVPTIALAGAADFQQSVAFFGLVASNIADGTYGYVIHGGIVHELNTSLLSTPGPLYLSATPGQVTTTRPVYPNAVVGIGGVLKVDASEGKIYVIPSWQLHRRELVKSYSFTSQGISAGTFYGAGFYDAPVAEANLDQASPLVTYGTATSARGGHAFAVAGGVGSVDAGTIGLRVNGTSITDVGVLTTSDTETISTDITTLSTDEYLETNKKFLGSVEWELYIVDGSPTTYSLDFNYGFAKYEDISNKDFYIDSIEVVGLAGATDTSFNIELLHHKFTGWTYHATAFLPGNGAIESMSNDLGAYDNLVTGEPFWWKHTEINQYILGAGNEGVLFRITCGQNNSVQAMDFHLMYAVEKH